MRLTRADVTERAMRLITGRNQTLLPALNRTKFRTWKRLGNVVVLRVRPDALCGRKTA